MAKYIILGLNLRVNKITVKGIWDVTVSLCTFYIKLQDNDKWYSLNSLFIPFYLMDKCIIKIKKKIELDNVII